ncbi:MAG: uncharacterized protein KVP18_001258 [Porospora cf. gigantea A]|uniref:uncharacterized protein n=1 Tax=Porospora cf. gigantea A TaxID=2853593 RepID=UPI00355ABAF6|nr:MAG: hypothetical protein KVP18_001258 [Porospora cf. gigantea A]
MSKITPTPSERRLMRAQRKHLEKHTDVDFVARFQRALSLLSDGAPQADCDVKRLRSEDSTVCPESARTLPASHRVYEVFDLEPEPLEHLFHGRRQVRQLCHKTFLASAVDALFAK